MRSIEYKNKDWQKRVLTYTDNEDEDIISDDIMQIIKQWAVDIKIN